MPRPYTLHEAAQLLGVSLNTVRRKIARSELKAERVLRPQGHVWHVVLPDRRDAAPPSNQPPAGTVPQPPAEIERAEQLAIALRPLVEAAP